MLRDEELAHWETNGFLILPGFFRPDQVAAIDAAEAQAWAKRHPEVVVDDLATHQRRKLCRVSEADRREHIFKVNDLYLCSAALRDVAMHPRLAAILRRLLQDPPVLCNTLSFTKGSQQPEHMDSLYMTPRTPGHLAATWIALEDCHPDSGPLFYYPGSHRIPLYRFSDGSYHEVDGEVERWRAYVQGKMAEAGMRREHFAAKRGDVFIWHANLIHGGSAIRDKARTRRSLVSHYFSLTDCRALGLDCRPTNGGYWLRRPPAPVPDDVDPPATGGPIRRIAARVWNRVLRRAS
jgi:ectoine hydroxylase-related dioxygenase (phytanoyl-CoA dioxygenase family)